jgi:flagellar hook-length control protein FliK|tara:strand:+ start:93 stop:1001 length:909 start_codon:yes stop_codon:yes gene_type:complete
MNSVSVEIPMDNNLKTESSEKPENSLFSEVTASQFQPIFTQFLKGTELSGKVHETLLKKFGDTYIETGTKQNISSSQIEPIHKKSERNNPVNRKQKTTTERGNPNPVEEKTTPEKPLNRPNPISRLESKNSFHLKSLSVTGLDHKTPDIQTFKANTFSQPLSQSVQKVNRIQLVTRITQIIHGNNSSNGTKSATYRIDGGQWGELEIKLMQKNSLTKATVVIESESLKSIIEKIVTDVKENLNEKGMRFESFNVEVGSDKHHYTNKKGTSQKIFIETEHEETLPENENVLRQFGYNTIEVIA